MSTIPVSPSLVDVIPNVLSAGGNALVLSGLLLTANPRVPVGDVLSFPSAAAVSTYFGPSAQESTLASIYFNGFDGSTQKPAAMLFAQETLGAVGAYLRGGSLSGVTLTDLQGFAGSFSVTVDGSPRVNNALDLSTATSFSSAASIIQTGLNLTPVQTASVTGTIAPETAAFTGSIAGNLLTVTAVASGLIVPGAHISGTGVTAGTQVTGQLSGTPNGEGTYSVSKAQGAPSTAIAATYGLLTVTAVGSGVVSIGAVLSGTNVGVGTKVTGFNSGTGNTGTYYVDLTATAASTTITADAAPVAVTYDSIAEAFVIASGITGAASTIAYAAGALATDLLLTAATEAVISEGADATTPGALMDSITAVSQAWATFTTTFDPDDGVGNAQKQALALWNNGKDKRFAYLAWDTDQSPVSSSDATTSLGNICQTLGYNGIVPLGGTVADGWDAGMGPMIAAFIAGTAASVDYDAPGGRITYAYRAQAGLPAGVSDETAAANLLANGYNFYGAYANGAPEFLFLQNGQVSGEFLWLDSYLNQVWLNSSLTANLLSLLQNSNTIPYNTAGYTQIKTACLDSINAALANGVIQAGVTLSASQAAAVNAAAGLQIASTIETAGWYLQVVPASPLTRQQRKSPTINLWYTDGQSVQQIVVNSVLII